MRTQFFQYMNTLGEALSQAKPRLKDVWKNLLLAVFGFWAFMRDQFHKGMISFFILAWVILIAWSLLEDRVFLIEPFQVPPKLMDMGYNGHTFASRIIDQIHLIRSKAKTNEPKKYVPGWSVQDIDITVADISVKIYS